ncbi:Arm DNA-binding domain-containing protein [Thauera sinica]|uniref:Arm DNA-binding domain-containing protein n=1 Tax=Thauera sinica TaxID=2665146 RepID=A0ABW1APD7_9RHOO|nr:Arm DNA-binding domain-containing protein [Thauera sp. K11]
MDILIFLWDSEAPGLAVRATPVGEVRAFIFQGKLNGKDLRATIGDARAWSIDAVRAEARRLQTLIDQGTDPCQEKADKRAAIEAAKAAEEATLRALCAAYTAHLERSGKGKSAAATRSSFKCHVLAAHPTIAEMAARDVTAHQAAAMVRKVREAGKVRAAGILRSYLSAAFNAAKRAPFDSALPSDLIPFGIEHNPVDAIPAIPVRCGAATAFCRRTSCVPTCRRLATICPTWPCSWRCWPAGNVWCNCCAPR